MKTVRAILLILAITAAQKVLADTYQFTWTPTLTSQSQFDAFLLYSGSSTTGSTFFAPISLIDYSFGTAAGPITPLSADTFFQILNATPNGPDFFTGPFVQPLSFQVNINPSTILVFNGGIEIPQTLGVTPTFIAGAWTETVIPVPDPANSWWLLATSLAALGIFSKFRRLENAGNC